MASTSSQNNHEAATKGRDAAEAYFKLGNLDSAINEAMEAKTHDPDLLYIDNFITAYRIHKAVSEKKSWYEVLGIPETADSQTIKKQYKELALVVHPDKNSSLTADGAFRHVKTALDILSDPQQKEDYDKSLSRGGSGKSFSDRNRTQFHRFNDDDDYFQKAGCKNKRDRTDWKTRGKAKRAKTGRVRDWDYFTRRRPANAHEPKILPNIANFVR
ncbi:uncharacterized protein LOC133716189 [Rosa rugosa]|uniref:uncharacterized protein LOC133716189 n=1 Tax=Rosa rugosa TaxID=74645 RepID=UPI002B40F206|nr:uncharacterized protein LOC133716189 [Rosa rugosa]